MFTKAEAYESYMGRWSRLLAPELVAFAGVGEADLVLDVGCGTGALSFAVLDSAANGRVTGVDLSPDFVAYASNQQHPRASLEVGDAEHLSFADDSFDAVLSALVLNFVRQPDAAVREMIRVTKSGGIVAATVWDYGQGMQMLRAFWDEAAALNGGPLAQDQSGMPLSGSGELAALFSAEGLEQVEGTYFELEQRFASFDDYWQPFLLGQGSAGAYVTGLSTEDRGALEARLRARLHGDGQDRALTMRSGVWAAKGRVAG